MLIGFFVAPDAPGKVKLTKDAICFFLPTLSTDSKKIYLGAKVWKRLQQGSVISNRHIRLKCNTVYTNDGPLGSLYFYIYNLKKKNRKVLEEREI